MKSGSIPPPTTAVGKYHTTQKQSADKSAEISTNQKNSPLLSVAEKKTNTDVSVRPHSSSLTTLPTPPFSLALRQSMATQRDDKNIDALINIIRTPREWNNPMGNFVPLITAMSGMLGERALVIQNKHGWFMHRYLYKGDEQYYDHARKNTLSTDIYLYYVPCSGKNATQQADHYEVGKANGEAWDGKERIKSDGDCFFRALYYALPPELQNKRTEEEAIVFYRNMIADFAYTNKDKIAGFFTEAEVLEWGRSRNVRQSCKRALQADVDKPRHQPALLGIKQWFMDTIATPILQCIAPREKTNTTAAKESGVIQSEQKEKQRSLDMQSTKTSHLGETPAHFAQNSAQRRKDMPYKYRVPMNSVTVGLFTTLRSSYQSPCVQSNASVKKMEIPPREPEKLTQYRAQGRKTSVKEISTSIEFTSQNSQTILQQAEKPEQT